MGNQSSNFKESFDSTLNGADKFEQQIGYNNYTINHTVLKNTQFICEDQFLISNHLGLVPTKMKTRLTMQTFAEVDQWQRKREKAKFIKNNYLLFPIQVITAGQTTFGYYKELQLVFHCFPYVLMDEILMRKKNNHHFEENQIWYTLWTLADSASTLLSNKLPIGDIRPHNILFNETGDIKIINQLSWPKEKSNYEKIIKDRVKTYASPQQIQLINKGVEVDTSVLSTSQSFSIGLTILSLLYLQDGLKLYKLRGQNRIQVEFDFQTFHLIIRNMSFLKYYNSKLQKQINYSYSLLKIVEGLCSLQQNQRHSIVTIWQILKPFSHQIINFQPFSIPNTSVYFQKETKVHFPQRNLPITNHVYHILPTVRQEPIPSSNIPFKEHSQIRQFMPIDVKPNVLPNKVIYTQSLNPVMIGNVIPFNVEQASFSKSLNYQQKDEQKRNIMRNHNINMDSHLGQLRTQSEAKRKSFQQQQNRKVKRGEQSSKKNKKIYISSTLQKSSKQSPIESLESSRYNYQQGPQLDSNKTNLIVSKWVSDQEGSKNPYSSITLQKVISTQDNINSVNNGNFGRMTEKYENKKQVKIQKDEQLLAMVEKQLLKSKSLFPSQK